MSAKVPIVALLEALQQNGQIEVFPEGILSILEAIRRQVSDSLPYRLPYMVDQSNTCELMVLGQRGFDWRDPTGGHYSSDFCEQRLLVLWGDIQDEDSLRQLRVLVLDEKAKFRLLRIYLRETTTGNGWALHASEIGDYQAEELGFLVGHGNLDRKGLLRIATVVSEFLRGVVEHRSTRLHSAEEAWDAVSTLKLGLRA